MPRFNRRHFLCFLGFGSAGLATAALRGSRSRPNGAGRGRVCLRRALFGTTVEITVLDADPQKGRAAIEAAFQELSLVERLMSIYRADSQLTQLNQTKQLRSPHPYLVEVLCQARQMSERSSGAFDVTVQPLWEAFARASQEKGLPETEELERARAQVDWRRVEVSPEHVRLDGTDTKITLNGIAQGFAQDRAAAALRTHGIEHALIDTGELGAWGQDEGGEVWLAGIQHPRDPEAYIALAELKGRCLATSGDYATPFTADLRHHHLLDPRSGYSPVELSSVSVLAHTGSEADALSTAVFVLGRVQGAALIAATPGADALLVAKDGSITATEGFPQQRQA